MSNDFSTATLVQAIRKVRTCFWCHEPMPAGSHAVKVAAKYDGVFSAVYVHPDCNHAWLRDPCVTEEEGCIYRHARGKTCNETTDSEEGRIA